MNTTQDTNGENRVEIARRNVADKLGNHIGKPVFIRIFKEEAVLEIWVENACSAWSCVYQYPIAGMSGTLGPKLQEGDQQAPEGFYRVYPQQLNPRSKYHLAMNIGYPNAYDQQCGRSGSFIMIHGGTSSQGCFAMTDAFIEEIYILVESALNNGCPYIPVQIYPFRMTDDRMQQMSNHPHFSFWQHLLPGYKFTESHQAPYPDSDASFNA